MSLTWVTLIQKRSVLFNLMHHAHVRAISGSAEACLHTAQTIMLMCQCTVWIQVIMPQFTRILLYKRHFYTKTPERLALCMPLHNHFFQFSMPGALPPMCHWNMSHITFVIHCTFLTSVGDTGVEGPAEGKFIKTSPQQKQKPSVTNQQTTWACLFTVGLWKLVLSALLNFSVAPLVGSGVKANRVDGG